MQESSAVPPGRAGRSDQSLICSVPAVLPPFSNTGVESGDVGLSWLGGTIRSDDGEGVGWGLTRRLGGPSTLTGSTVHYRAGVRADDWSWSVMWGGMGGAVGTVYATIRQSYLERVGSDGLALARDLLRDGYLASSRVDLAGDDLRGSGPRPRWYFDRRAEAWTRTQRGRWQFTEQGSGSQTLYVGSRSSDRMLRLYDHAPSVLRHELELKGVVAAGVGVALGSGASVADLWAAEYGRLVRWAA